MGLTLAMLHASCVAINPLQTVSDISEQTTVHHIITYNAPAYR